MESFFQLLFFGGFWCHCQVSLFLHAVLRAIARPARFGCYLYQQLVWVWVKLLSVYLIAINPERTIPLCLKQLLRSEGEVPCSCISALNPSWATYCLELEVSEDVISWFLIERKGQRSHSLSQALIHHTFLLWLCCNGSHECALDAAVFGLWDGRRRPCPVHSTENICSSRSLAWWLMWKRKI